MTGLRGRRRRRLLNDLKEMRGYSHLKAEALDRSMWRVRFGSVVRETNKLMNIILYIIYIIYFYMIYYTIRIIIGVVSATRLLIKLHGAIL